MAMGMLVVPTVEPVDELGAPGTNAQPTPTPTAIARKIHSVR